MSIAREQNNNKEFSYQFSSVPGSGREEKRENQQVNSINENLNWKQFLK
jgi:hypothetical protein